MRFRPRSTAIIARMLYLALSIYGLVADPEHHFLFGTIVFFCSMITSWSLASILEDERWYLVDVAVCALFGGAMLLGLLGVAMPSDIIGIDKLFHFAGGAILAWSAFLFFEKRVRSRATLAWSLIITAFAVGVIWECYEWFFQLNVRDLGLTFVDTVGDVIADAAGGIVVASSILFRMPKKKLEK